MRFTVTWVSSALKELADLWLAHADPPAVTRASNQVDLLLKVDAHDIGESREDGK
jgi:hypothetical protein